MTKLRVALAMGGGVSLGAFSGAALTEALKILTLFGRDRHGQPFEKVVVDVFSGASAGSMSLLIMLRYLVDSPATLEEIKKYFEKDPTVTAQVKEAIERLDDATKDDAAKDDTTKGAATKLFYQKDFSRLQDVVALEILQQFQEKIWTQDVQLPQLLTEIPFDRRGGLLDRAALESVAKKHMEGLFNSIKIAKLKEGRPPVLAERVAFASTLTCLTPVVYDGRKAFNVAKLLMPAVSDGLTSLGHRDQRVFDINFRPLKQETISEIKKINDLRVLKIPNLEEKEDVFDGNLSQDLIDYPLRWVRAHSTEKVPNVAYDLYSPDFWAKLTTTSLASGAFPGAFDPVPLKRYWWEYGLKYWPPPLRRNSASEAEFLFVDGGTLDNEPIRQAFRMASFFDSITLSEECKGHPVPPDFERVVLFVDPTISHCPEDLSLRLDLWSAESVEKNRLVEVLKCLIAVLMDESTVLEANRVDGTLNLFQERELLKDFLLNKDCIINGKTSLKSLKSLADHLESLLARSALTHMMPTAPAGVLGELKRILWELYPNDITKIEGVIRSYNQLMQGDQLSCEPEEFVDLARTLLLVAADRLMDLEGKSRNSHLIAIVPMDPSTQDRKSFMMPAGKYFGFGGLMSREAAEHAARVGKHSAAKTLWYFASLGEADSNLSSSRPPLRIKLDEDRKISSISSRLLDLNQKKVDEEMKHSMKAIRNYVGNILGQVTDSSLVNFFLKRKGTDMIINLLDPSPIRMPIKIPLGPTDKLAFWKKPGRWYYVKEEIVYDDSFSSLSTWITKDPKTNEWKGPHIEGGKLQLFDDTLSLLGYPKVRREIELPSSKEMDDYEKQAEEMAYPSLILRLDSGTWDINECTSNSFEQSFTAHFRSQLVWPNT